MAKTRSQQRADVQSAVIRVATRLFVEKGYKETTMADISLESGIHIGSIYNIFRDKEDIVCEIAMKNAGILNDEARRLLGCPDRGEYILFPSAEILTLASYSPRFARLMCVAYSSSKTMESGLEIQRAWLTRDLSASGLEFDSDGIVSVLCACNGAMAGMLTRYCNAPRTGIRNDLVLLARICGTLLGTPADADASADAVLRVVDEHPPETLGLSGIDPDEMSVLRRGDSVGMRPIASKGPPMSRPAASSKP